MQWEVKPLIKSKTFWGAMSVIAATIGGWLAGEIPPYAAIMAICGAVTGIFYRKDQAKPTQEAIAALRKTAPVIVMALAMGFLAAGPALADAYLVCDPQQDAERFLVRVVRAGTDEAYVPADAGELVTVPEDGLEYFTATHEAVDGQGIRIWQVISDIPAGDWVAIARAANGWGRSGTSNPSEFTRPSLTPPVTLQLTFSTDGP